MTEELAPLTESPNQSGFIWFLCQVTEMFCKKWFPLSLTIKVKCHIHQFDQTQSMSGGNSLFNLTDLRFTHVYSCLSLEVLRITGLQIRPKCTFVA